MRKSKSFLSILIPSATVFISSGCIMVLELVAGRLIARHLGASLYTWTSVIGVVLAGITIGNYFGGRIADRFNSRKALAMLFGVCSIACAGTVILNNLVGEWQFLLYFKWPLRVFTHVSLVFLIPSTLLGTISPVVAKMALDQGLPTGKTVGDIYAWGAAGSIVGTFVAGFYLIATMGTVAIIWTTGAVLLAMAILYRARFWALYVWALIFIVLMIMGIAPGKWAENAGASFRLRKQSDPTVLYEDESQYCYIAVRQLSKNPDRREFLQDQLEHSKIIMGEIKNLQYSYEQIYAAVTHRASQDKDKLSVLGIGGGGYVFPRYIEDVWPGSHVDVVEIDHAVTKAAVQAFGLETDTTINTFIMDARNYVERLRQLIRTGREIVRYDFVYEDAFNDYSVPYQLVTKEFNDKVAEILTDDGVYMVNLIDIVGSGLFIGSFVNTLEQTFPYVYVITEKLQGFHRSTFVVIASKRKINLEGLNSEEAAKDLHLWMLSNFEIELLKEKAHKMVLTDNYVPVENLLAPVVQAKTADIIERKCLKLAEKLERGGKIDESIAIYKALVKSKPSILLSHQLATMQVQHGRLHGAVETFRRAIEYGEQLKIGIDTGSIHLDLGLLLKELKQSKESREHIYKAIEGFRKELTNKQGTQETVFRLGVALAEIGEFSEAIKYLQQAVNMNLYDTKSPLTLAKTLVVQKRYDEAIEQLHKGIRFMSEQGQKDGAMQLQSYLEEVEFEKSKHKR